MFNPLIKCLDDNNNVLTSNQSAFSPGDSYVYQLLSVTYKIYKWFHVNPPLDV